MGEYRTTAATAAPPVPTELATVLSALAGGVMDGGEIVLLAIKPSRWRPFFDSASWILFVLVVIAALGFTGRTVPGLSLATTAQLLLLVAFSRLAWAIAQWIPRWHLLTNRRVINVEGLRCPNIHSFPLVRIRNTYLRRSVPESTVGVGTILFVTSDASETPQVWRSVRNPSEVHARIRRAIENALDHHAVN
jgi:hypothetical protein